MERLTKRIDNNHVCFAVCEKECPDGIYADNPACMCTAGRAALKKLLRYEDTGLTPEQIMELKEAVQRLDKIFGDEITVDQVIDFFVDFYIAQGDPDRVEAAELLTNEEVARYKELKERDVAKPLMERHYGEPGDKPYIKYTCPNGCKIQPSRKSKFCSLCGQRLKWDV